MPPSKIVRDPYPSEKLIATLNDWWIVIAKWRELHGIVGFSAFKASERDVLSAKLAFDYRFDFLPRRLCSKFLAVQGS